MDNFGHGVSNLMNFHYCISMLMNRDYDRIIMRAACLGKKRKFAYHNLPVEFFGNASYALTSYLLYFNPQVETRSINLEEW